MDGVEFRDSQLFTQDENHCVVAKAATGMDRYGRRLINHKHFTIVHQNLQGFTNYGGLMAVHCVLHVVVILWRVLEAVDIYKHKNNDTWECNQRISILRTNVAQFRFDCSKCVVIFLF